MCAIMNTILIIYVGVQADVENDPRIAEICERATRLVNAEFENACERNTNKVSPMIMQLVIHTHALHLCAWVRRLNCIHVLGG